MPLPPYLRPRKPAKGESENLPPTVELGETRTAHVTSSKKTRIEPPPYCSRLHEEWILAWNSWNRTANAYDYLPASGAFPESLLSSVSPETVACLEPTHCYFRTGIVLEKPQWPGTPSESNFANAIIENLSKETQTRKPETCRYRWHPSLHTTHCTIRFRTWRKSRTTIFSFPRAVHYWRRTWKPAV